MSTTDPSTSAATGKVVMRPIKHCGTCSCGGEEPDYAATFGTVSDDYQEWVKCDHPKCGLEVVRVGKVQCWCDDPEGVPWEDEDD